MTDVFPPALVPVLRDRFAAVGGCLPELSDDVLVSLLTTAFFASLETYEGERNPVQVVCIGKGRIDTIVPTTPDASGAPIYRWKLMPFETPRPCNIAELVKLAVANVHERVYTAVHVHDDGQLAIAGLAREGNNVDTDRFFKIVTSKPGCLSIRNGRRLVLEYERGTILTGGEEMVFSAQRVRRALESTARSAGLGEDDLLDYLEAVRALVREMASHGRGGIIIVHPEERPQVAERSAYRMALDSSLTSLLRLARRIGRVAERPSRPSGRLTPRPDDPVNAPFREVLRNAFLLEAERVIEEIGALTGIDGATVLGSGLSLVAFGVILPVEGATDVVDDDGATPRAADLRSRGTRHRASATYAARHPGSVVFVASEDGAVTCMSRDPAQHEVRVWHLGPVDIHAA